ncbi:MAG: flagellar protein FlaG [Desulfitobacteriaceae bacterium]
MNERLQPLPNIQPPALVNHAGDESKVISKEIGLTSVSRQAEMAKTGNETLKQDLSRREVEKIAQRLNKIMGFIEKRLQFSVHAKSGQVQVKVINQETGEVMDEIPPKRLLDLMASFRDMTGIFVDSKG